MDITREVPNIKQCRRQIDIVLQQVKELDSCRETDICIIKLQEAIMWLGMDLKRLNEKNPYPESMNPDSMRIEPTADNLKF